MGTPESTHILRKHPTTKEAALLIAELDAYLGPLYPTESNHGYSIDKLVEHQVEFYVLYYEGRPAGCAGVQFFSAGRGADCDYGELKRMYVRDEFRGRGLGRKLLDHVEALALSRGMVTVRLETGIYQPEAVALYEKCGYYRIPLFGDYWDDPVGLCYEKRLGASGR